ncbi:MAG: arsenate reductase ArsC [Thermoproteota archaeon]|jgi:arsenate reductase (thioredoxin)|nr:arsenate reductase ArsC [Thermoproteota archaeon]
MKFFKREPTKLILFVCVENTGRSQMAEGHFNKYAPKGYEAISAGTRPVSQINPIAVQVMRESGIDISNQKSKELTEDMMRNSSNIVNMGCVEKESCPTLFLQNLVDWNIEDPKDKPIEKVRKIRDEIDQRVKELVASIKIHQ